MSRYAAPSTGAFDGISPAGAMHGCIALPEGPGMALLATPVESEEHRKQAASGAPFLWVLSFRLHGEPAPLYRACRS